MKWIDFAIILGYLVLTAAVGLLASRRVRATEDYALAGRKLGYGLTIGTLVATMIGASATMGKAGMSYQYGVAMMWDGLAIFIGYLIFAAMAGKLRRSGVWTATGVLERRYGGRARTLGAWVLLFAVVAVYGAQLVAVGILFKLVGAQIGLSQAAAILLAGAVLIAYTYLGGMVAVAYTDLIQFLIMIPVIGLVLPLVVLGQVPLADLSLQLPANMLDFWHGLPPMFILSLLLTFVPGVIVDPTIWQRTMSARDNRVARVSPLVSAGIYLYWSLVVVGLGMAGALLFPGLLQEFGSADPVIPLLIVDHLPPGLTGLGLTALLAVAMSTASSTLLIASVVGSRDIAPSFRRGQALAPDQELRLSRWITLGVGVAGLVFALGFSSIFEIMMLAYGIFIAGMFVPLILGLYWRKATRQGAIISGVLATLALVALYAVPTPVDPIVGAMAISVVTMVGVSLATYRPETATPPILSDEALAQASRPLPVTADGD